MRTRQLPSMTGFVRLLAVFGVVSAGTVAVTGSQASAAAPPISINGSEPGRTFDGLGGMSVSAESRLLFDYPRPQRSQILDYLYCSPMAQAAAGYCTHGTYGAALQRLKVEIGADTDSTIGAEPSTERQPGVVDCHVGYEFKMMAAARKRNPQVQIDALAWGWPGWINPSGANVYDRVFSRDTINYLLNYLGCAKANGTPVNTLGIWNEIPYLTADRTQSEQWIATLRQALDDHGYSKVQLIADDGAGWAPIGVCSNPQSATDTAFCNSVSIFGNHYPAPGSWLHQNGNQYSYVAPAYDGTWSASYTPGTSETLTFTGTSIKWIADTCYNAGMADVYLDGQLAAHDVDDYSPANAPGATSVGCVFQQALFSRSGLSPGQHTIKIVLTGAHNPQASGPFWIYSDAFAVDGPPNGTSGPCSVQECIDDQSPQVQYSSVPPASGKPLWATEDAPGLYDTTDGIDWYHNLLLRGDWAGARYLAQEINTNYVGIGVTAEDIYALLSSFYDQGAYAKDGLMTADTPWAAAGSGPSYDVQSRVWVAAHTTQFTKPGTWRYVGDPASADDTASCYLGTSSCTDSSGETGSYVTLRSTQGSDYAIVAETKDATSAQPEQFCLSGGLSTGTVHVWETNASTAFSNVANLSTSNGCFSYTLDPNAEYTFTSENTGHAGSNTQDYAEQGMTLPYSDNFQSYGPSRTQPRYFEDQQGAFETGHACPPGGNDWCLQQAVTTEPIQWAGRAEPHTIIGNLAWKDYQVQAHLTIPTVGQNASVIGRMQRSRSDGDLAEEGRYQAQVTNEGNGTWHWTLYRVDAGPSYHALASGDYTNGSAWIALALNMSGSQLSVQLDGKTVGQATDSTYTAGMAGLATGSQGSTYDVADFDNFCIQAPGSGHC